MIKRGLYKRCYYRKCERKGVFLHAETNFYKHRGSKNGRRNICKKCYVLAYGQSMKRSAEKRKSNMKIGGGISSENKKRVLGEFGYRCALTGESETVTVDHFVPLAFGEVAVRNGIGGNTIKNLIPLIEPLNKSKYSNNPFIWFENLNELKVKYGVCDQKWRLVVEYIATNHNMTPFEYMNKVNNSYWEVIVKRGMELLNHKLETQSGKYKPYNIILYLLKNCTNLDVVINIFGSSKAKEFYKSKETKRRIDKYKEILQQESGNCSAAAVI